MSRNRLGELLVREKRISLEQLREAQKQQKDDNVSLGYALARSLRPTDLCTVREIVDRLEEDDSERTDRRRALRRSGQSR